MTCSKCGCENTDKAKFCRMCGTPLNVEVPKAESEPVKEGHVYGEAVVKYKDEISLGTVELAAGRNVEESNVLYLLNSVENLIFSKWFTVFIVTSIVLLVLYWLLSVYFASRRKKLKHYRGSRFNKM